MLVPLLVKPQARHNATKDWSLTEGVMPSMTLDKLGVFYEMKLSEKERDK